MEFLKMKRNFTFHDVRSWIALMLWNFAGIEKIQMALSQARLQVCDTIFDSANIHNHRRGYFSTLGADGRQKKQVLTHIYSISYVLHMKNILVSERLFSE